MLQSNHVGLNVLGRPLLLNLISSSKPNFAPALIFPMVLILDGNSEHVAQA